jgi:hypothetical protein
MLIQHGAIVRMEKLYVRNLNKIKYVILSKDRACQLDLLLRSIDKNMPDLIEPMILYRASTAEFEDGYHYIQEKCYNCTPIFLREIEGFRSDVIDASCYDGYELTGILTDDTVFFKNPSKSYSEILDFMKKYNCQSFSTRIGKNTNEQCHYRHEAIPDLIIEKEENGMFWFDSSKYRYDINFGRPISLDGHFHFTGPLLETMVNTSWNCPRTLDGMDTSRVGPRIACFNESITVSIPVNLTCDGRVPDNFGHFYSYSLEELNNRFLNGQVIDMGKIDFSKVNMSHMEFPLFFKDM